MEPSRAVKNINTNGNNNTVFMMNKTLLWDRLRMEESYLVKTKDIKFNKTLFVDKRCASEVGIVLCIAETKLFPFKLKKPNNENVVYNIPFQTQN